MQINRVSCTFTSVSHGRRRDLAGPTVERRVGQARHAMGCLVLPLVMPLALASATAHALPDPKRGDDLARIGLSPADTGGATLLLDHEENTLYVGPAANKTMEGVFSFIDGPLSCDALSNIRETTYRYPRTEEDVTKVINSGKAYSPSFDATFGVYARNANLVSKILAAKAATTGFVQTHSAVYSAFVEAKTNKDAIDTQLARIDAGLSAAKNDLAVALLGIPPTFNKKQREDAITRLNAEYLENFKATMAERARLNKANITALDAYSKALGAWAPYRDQNDWLQGIENSLQSGFTTLQSLANDSFSRSEALVERLERRSIGVASAAYNIHGDEVDRVRAALAARGVQKNVSRLPIFDVRLNSGVTRGMLGRTGTGTADASGTGPLDFQLVTVSLPAETISRLGEPVAKDSGLKTASGKPLSIIYGDDSERFGGSGSVQSLVTQGAYCGTPKVTMKKYVYSGPNGNAAASVTETSYESPRGNVFSQAVALGYKYYAKAEPISGNCTLDVSKMSDYWRNAGYSKTWNLSGSKTVAWDSTKTTYKDRMGLSCDITQRPVGLNADDSKRMNEALEQSLYGDMFSMFVMQYGKEYKLEKNPMPPTPGELHPLATLGNGVMTLCGGVNVYCAVTGLVLKTVDEMVGARHNGTTSSNVDVSGIITRNFSKDSYFVAEGTSTVLMTVKASN